MAADAARREATYEDVLRAPEHVVAEVLNGDLHTRRCSLAWTDARANRAGDLMRKYRDVPMDYADATLVALAEELDTPNVFTLDRGSGRTVGTRGAPSKFTRHTLRYRNLNPVGVYPDAARCSEPAVHGPVRSRWPRLGTRGGRFKDDSRDG
jgi:predicted nucleic acid-binding protein